MIRKFITAAFATAFMIGIGYANNHVSLSVYGIGGQLLTNVNNRLQLELKNNKKNDSQFIRSFYHNAPESIVKAMQPFGYFHPRIKSHIYQDVDKHWYIEFAIQRGEPITLTKVSIKISGAGKTDPAFERFVKHYPLKVGDVLNTEKYSSEKNKLLDIANARGYFNAKLIISKIKINLTSNQAKIIIRYDTGKRFKFGVTNIKAKFYDHNFIRRFLTYKKGQYFNSKYVTQLQEGFTSSDYFNSISIVPNTHHDAKARAKNLVPMDVYLTPSPAKQFQLGAGYGTDTRLRGMLGVKFRHITSTGQHAAAFFRGSDVESYLVANYYIPGENPATDTYQIGVAAGKQNLSNSKKSRNFKIYTGYTTQYGHLQQSIMLNYLDENYNIPSIFKGTINANLLYPSFDWKYGYFDNKLNPNNGYGFDLKLSGADKAIFSHTTFGQALLSAKFLATIMHNTRLLVRSQLGATSIGAIGNLPLSLQFFAGGANSVRGYGYKSMGPGRYLFTSSVELQQRIMGNWYAAVFYDAGNVSDSFLPKLLRGAGPGIVWRSPIGPFELTIAKPIDRPRRHWSIQFTMGPNL